MNQSAIDLGTLALEETCVDCEGSGELSLAEEDFIEDCPRCKGTGYTLTPSGQTLVRFISIHFNLVSPSA